MALAYLTGSVTQGSNDAFAQAEIATALQGISRTAFRIRELLFEFPGLGNANAVNIELALTRRTKAAMPNVNDRDVIAKYRRQQVLLTSGLINYETAPRFTFTEDDELLIVEDPIYFSIDSNATGASNVAYVRIGYERTNISDVDRLTLLTQSLE